MSFLDNKNKNLDNKKHHDKDPFFLGLAEIALKLGAGFGLLAVLALVLLSWTYALAATIVSVIALIIALIVLTLSSQDCHTKRT